MPIHAIAFSEDVQTPPQRVRQVAELAADGHFHLLQGLGHGSAFGHRPDEVNAAAARDHRGYAPAASDARLARDALERRRVGQQPARVVVGRRLEHLAHGAVLDDATAVQHGDAVRDRR